jgi:hypothetical protein
LAWEAERTRRGVRALDRAIKRSTTPPWRRARNIIAAIVLVAVLVFTAIQVVNRVTDDGKAGGCYSYPARVIAFNGPYTLMQSYPIPYCQWWVYVGYYCTYGYPIAYGPPAAYGCGGGGGGGGGW